MSRAINSSNDSTRPETRRHGKACPIAVAKLDRLSRDVHFISGLMADRIAASIGRWRSPGHRQDPILIVSRNPVAKLDLDRRPRDHYALDGGAQAGGGFSCTRRRGFSRAGKPAVVEQFAFFAG